MNITSLYPRLVGLGGGTVSCRLQTPNPLSSWSPTLPISQSVYLQIPSLGVRGFRLGSGETNFHLSQILGPGNPSRLLGRGWKKVEKRSHSQPRWPELCASTLLSGIW